MRRLYLALLLSAGCDAVFQLDRSYPPDAAPDAPCMADGPDEDGDCISDDKDLCPGTPDPAQGDADKDGVGDACDARRGTKGDRLVELITFTDPADATRWFSNDGKWHLDGESAAISSDAFDPARYSTFRDTKAMSPRPLYVILHATIDRIDDAHAQLGVIANTRGPDSGGSACSLLRVDDNLTEDFVQAFEPSMMPQQDHVDRVHDGDGLEIRFHYEPSTGTSACEIRPDMGVSMGQSIPPFAADPEGNIALSANGLSAHVEYIAVYTH